MSELEDAQKQQTLMQAQKEQQQLAGGSQPKLSVFGTQLPEPDPSLGEKAKTFVTESAQSLDDTIRVLASGAAFGYADELAAGVNSLLGLGTYDELLAGEMAKDEAIREREPGAALAGEIAGGVGGAIATGNVAGAIPYVAKAGAALKGLPSAVKMGALGAAGGAAAGSGTAGPGERISGALYGGSVGLVLGGVAIPLAKAGVTATIRKFMGSGIGKDVSAAAQKIFKALQSDELTPDEAFRKVLELGPEGRLMDVGENTRRLARAVAGEPTKASVAGTKMLEGRQGRQGSRLVAAVNKALDPTNDFAGTADDLMRIRKDAARPLYEKAYANTVEPGEDMISLFRRPAMHQAWTKARKIAANDGDPLPDNLFTTRPDGGKIINPDAIRDVKLLDYIKRGLDDVVEPHRDVLTGKIKTNAGRGVDSLRKEYLRILDDLSPDYKAARASWAGPSRSLELMDRGRRFMRMDEEVTLRQIKNMTPDEQFFFRMGGARQLRETVLKTQDGGDAVKRIFGNQLSRDRVRAMFPDDETYNAFKNSMSQESTLFETGAIVSPKSGSQTQLRGADANNLSNNVSSGVADIAMGNNVGAARNFLRGLFGAGVDDMTPAQMEVLGKALFTNDAAVNKQIIKALSMQRMLESMGPVGGVAAVEAGRQGGTASAR